MSGASFSKQFIASGGPTSSCHAPNNTNPNTKHITMRRTYYLKGENTAPGARGKERRVGSPGRVVPSLSGVRGGHHRKVCAKPASPAAAAATVSSDSSSSRAFAPLGLTRRIVEEEEGVRTKKKTTFSCSLRKRRRSLSHNMFFYCI